LEVFTVMGFPRFLALGACIPFFGCIARLDLGGPSDAGADPGSNDVNGVVVSSQGLPVGYISILSGGSVVHADAQGRFVLRSAPPRYDVVIAMQPPPWTSDSSNSGIAIYQGLSTRDPVLTSPVNAQGAVVASVVVTYPPEPAGTWKKVFGSVAPFGSCSGVPWGPVAQSSDKVSCAVPGAATTSNATLAWLGFSVGHVTPDADLTVQHYLAFDRTDLTFQPFETVPWTPRAIPIGEMTVTGSVTTGPGQTVDEIDVGLRMSSTEGWSLLEMPTREPPWTALVPRIPGVSFAIWYSASDNGQQGSIGGGGTSALVLVGDDGTVPPVALPPPPRLASPPDGTSGFGSAPSASTLSWQGQGMCHVYLGPVSTMTALPSFDIYTTESSFTMPDLSPLGTAIPDSTPYFWTVSCSQTSEPGIGGDPVLVPSYGLGTQGYSGPANRRTVIWKR
jgi:hypothetical protein